MTEGADEVVWPPFASRSCHARLTGKLDGLSWPRTPSELGRLHPDPGSEPWNLQLDARPTSPPGTGSARPPAVVYMSKTNNVYNLYGSFVGDQGAWSAAKMYLPQAPGLPNQTVYGLQILDATRPRRC